MEYNSLKIFDLIKRSEEKEILLPNFQREYVWERKTNQKGLLTSIIYDIPIGSLLILEGESNYFATKELCFKKEPVESSKETCLYLLDGQQRLSTIKSIFFDFFKEPVSWEENYNKLYPKLQTRWFLRIVPKEGEADLFGWTDLNFKGKLNFNNYEPETISQFIEFEILHPRQTDKWFHPEFKLSEWFDKKTNNIRINRKNSCIAEVASDKGLVPLYSIYDKQGSNSLHYKTLKDIASKRLRSLQTDVEDGLRNLKDIFGFEPEENELEDCWNGLKEDWVKDVNDFLENLVEKEIPIIKLSKDEMSRAIHTFEYVNKGGTPLSVYDLIVAKAAQNKDLESSLTDRIVDFLSRSIKLPDSLLNGLNSVDLKEWSPTTIDLVKEGNLVDFAKNQYLNLLSIYSNIDKIGNLEKLSREHIKRDKQLNLTSDQIVENTETTLLSLVRACAFLQFRCGIVKIGDLKYQLMVLPIAYILSNDKYWNDEKIINKLEYWYWSSLFGGAYRIRQNEQCLDDIKKLVNWFENNDNKFVERKEKVLKVQEYSDINTLLMKDEDGVITSAISKGIMQYILSRQPNDFLEQHIKLNAWDIASEKEYTFVVNGKKQKLKLEDHHICPLSGTTKLGESTKDLRGKKHILNSPLNRTFISSVANSLISDKTPQEYLKYVSEISIIGHFIPFPIIDKFAKKENENEMDYYERVLKERYNEIYKNLKSELDYLEN